MLDIHNDIIRFIEHSSKEIEKHFITFKNIEFHEVKLQKITLYVVYESKIRFILNRLSSYEIKEKGIILDDGNNFYYYDFKENYENKKEIIKKFVEKYYLG